MKKYKNFIIYTSIFIIIMILAIVGYNYLSKNYIPEEKSDFSQNEQGTNNQQNSSITNLSQSIGKDEITQNETTTLKKATDFSVLNNNRRKSKFI